jgi:hypothetical protein
VFGTEQHKLLILLSPSLGTISGRHLALVRELGRPENIQVVHASFEDIVSKAKECLSSHDEEMLALVNDYEAFCSDMGLLPRDEYTLFVPPCGQSFEDNEEFWLYYCPATWSRRNARYLGIYKEKRVRAIGRVLKVVACNVDAESGGWAPLPEATQTLTEDEELRIAGATRKAQSRGWDLTSGHKFTFSMRWNGRTSGRRLLAASRAIGISILKQSWATRSRTISRCLQSSSAVKNGHRGVA